MSPVDNLTKGAPLPKSIGLRADLYSDIRAVRLAMEKEVAEVKAREAEVRESIIEDLSKSDDTGAAGKRYRAQIVTKIVPKVAEGADGWPKLWEFIEKTGRFDLLQKRVGEKAVADMWAAGETVPGIEKMRIPEVSITKI